MGKLEVLGLVGVRASGRDGHGCFDVVQVASELVFVELPGLGDQLLDEGELARVGCGLVEDDGHDDEAIVDVG